MNEEKVYTVIGFVTDAGGYPYEYIELVRSCSPQRAGEKAYEQVRDRSMRSQFLHVTAVYLNPPMNLRDSE